MSFGFFFLGEYVSIWTVCCLNIIFFWGGFFVVFSYSSVIFYAFKVIVLVVTFIWVRGSLPRYRYDQLMRLGWKILLPISLGFVILYAGSYYKLLFLSFEQTIINNNIHMLEVRVLNIIENFEDLLNSHPTRKEEFSPEEILAIFQKAETECPTLLEDIICKFYDIIEKFYDNSRIEFIKDLKQNPREKYSREEILTIIRMLEMDSPQWLEDTIHNCRTLRWSPYKPKNAITLFQMAEMEYCKGWDATLDKFYEEFIDSLMNKPITERYSDREMRAIFQMAENECPKDLYKIIEEFYILQNKEFSRADVIGIIRLVTDDCPKGLDAHRVIVYDHYKRELMKNLMGMSTRRYFNREEARAIARTAIIECSKGVSDVIERVYENYTKEFIEHKHKYEPAWTEYSRDEILTIFKMAEIEYRKGWDATLDKFYENYSYESYKKEFIDSLMNKPITELSPEEILAIFQMAETECPKGWSDIRHKFCCFMRKPEIEFMSSDEILAIFKMSKNECPFWIEYILKWESIENIRFYSSIIEEYYSENKLNALRLKSIADYIPEEIEYLNYLVHNHYAAAAKYILDKPSEDYSIEEMVALIKTITYKEAELFDDFLNKAAEGNEDHLILLKKYVINYMNKYIKSF